MRVYNVADVVIYYTQKKKSGITSIFHVFHHIVETNTFYTRILKITIHITHFHRKKNEAGLPIKTYLIQQWFQFFNDFFLCCKCKTTSNLRKLMILRRRGNYLIVNRRFHSPCEMAKLSIRWEPLLFIHHEVTVLMRKPQ